MLIPVSMINPGAGLNHDTWVSYDPREAARRGMQHINNMIVGTQGVPALTRARKWPSYADYAGNARMLATTAMIFAQPVSHTGRPFSHTSCSQSTELTRK